MLERGGVPALAFVLLVVIIYQTVKRSGTRITSQLSMSSKDYLRLVIVSDTHRSYRKPIPPGDVLIHAGDSEWAPEEMDKWAQKLPHAHKLAISGNMDWRLSSDKDKLQNVTYLEDSEIVISGVKIYGSPWTPKFVGVFQLDNEQEGVAVWDKMPSKVDVLISHGPPAGILDLTSRGKRVGDRALLQKVKEVKPRVHCFGHIHESYGTLRSEGTLFCNGAVFNGHAPIVVDVPLDGKGDAVLVDS